MKTKREHIGWRDLASGARIFVWAFVIVCSTTTQPFAAPNLTVGVGAIGLTALNWAGTDLLADGKLDVTSAELSDSAGTITPADVVPLSSEFDLLSKTLTQMYAWGNVRAQYLTTDSRLTVSIRVTDTSKLTLQQFTLQLLSIHFPNPPLGWIPNYVYVDSNTGNPPVISADFGTGKLVVCNEDVGGRPVILGFPGRSDFSSRPLVLSTTPGWVLSPYLDPQIINPIQAGQSATYRISIRFAATGSGDGALDGDVLSRFVKAYPQTLNWPDHRPIGTIVISQMETKAHSATNQYGYFGDPDVDLVSPTGKMAFHERLLRYATDTIEQLKATGAQGVVVWDIEGQHYPQPTSYIGDPRLLPVLSPEMDAFADEFFSTFRNAGFRVGVCIRPQQLTEQPGGGYAQIDPKTNDETATVLLEKIKYAYRRWQCTLFYCDSNGDPNVPYDPAIFEKVTRELAKLKIQALIMPEHANARYYACTAPYKELRLNVAQTPESIKQLYPHAFSAIYLPDGPVDQFRAQLEQGVAGGDVLLFRSWWPDPFNLEVSRIYKGSRTVK